MEGGIAAGIAGGTGPVSGEVFLEAQLDDPVHRKLERADLFFRELDVNLPAKAALDAHRRDAGHALQPR